MKRLPGGVKKVPGDLARSPPDHYSQLHPSGIAYCHVVFTFSSPEIRYFRLRQQSSKCAAGNDLADLVSRWMAEAFLEDAEGGFFYVIGPACGGATSGFS